MSTQLEQAVKDDVNPAPNFITAIVEEDLEAGRIAKVVTRFPPEPNGYAHIMHAYASLISFGVAEGYNGQFNLRLDDTNPETERSEFAEAQIRDLAWLGLDWNGHLYYASDYFGDLYALAVRLIEQGNAYVDSLSGEDIGRYRGTVTEAGRPSPYRERSIEENLELFEQMRRGEFPEGAHALRAKIDMANPNMKLRDPVLYRILHTPHYRTGDAWHVYPMYDFAHPLSDALEGVTHSLCSSEFVENRAVYDWLVGNLFDQPVPHQYEFGRRKLEYTVVSKRKLISLIGAGVVTGWDDPRMPTLAGLRRRGVTPEALRDFVARVGVSRTNGTVDIALLDYAVRDYLNTRAPRVMAVLDPLKATLTNYPDDKSEWLEAPYFPPDVPKHTQRKVPFARELYIERDDFSETPPKGFKRLTPGGHVRLRHAFVIRCDEGVKNDEGVVTELRCTYLPDSLGTAPEGVKVRGAVHWVAAAEGVAAEIRLYDRLFTVPAPDQQDGDLLSYVNPESLTVREGIVEPSVLDDAPDTRYQFERQGYFWQDPNDSEHGALVFNRIVPLKDSWSDSSRTTPAKEQAPKIETQTLKTASRQGEAPDPVLSFSAEQRAELEGLLTLNVAQDDAVVLVGNPKLYRFFERAAANHANSQGIASLLVNDLRRDLLDDDPANLPFRASDLAELVTLIDDGTINNRIAKEVLAEMLEQGTSPQEIVAKRGLEQVTDEAAITPVIDKLLEDNADKVAAYREGKRGLIGFFVGAVMRETGGKANPQLVKSLLEARLET